MGKLSRYDAGELPEDRKKRRKTSRHAPAPSKHSSTDSARRPAKQEKRPEPGVKKSRSISNRVRDVKRLLAKVTDEEMKRALQSKLERLNRKFELKEKQDVLKKLSEKNRKIQFIDQKKLEKRLKRSKDEEETELIKNDMEYVRTFPKDRRYISLFDSSLDEETKKERDDLRIQAAVARAKRKESETSEAGSDQEGFGDDFFKEEAEEQDAQSSDAEDSE